MSKIAVYYVIRPQPSLLKAIEASGVGGTDLLTETELWEGDLLYSEDGMPNRHPDPNELSRVKLLFLGRLAWDYATENATDEAKANGLREFVSSLLQLRTGLHATTFDDFWTIERIEGPGFTCDDMENELKEVLAKYGTS